MFSFSGLLALGMPESPTVKSACSFLVRYTYFSLLLILLNILSLGELLHNSSCYYMLSLFMYNLQLLRTCLFSCVKCYTITCNTIYQSMINLTQSYLLAVRQHLNGKMNTNKDGKGVSVHA